MTFLAVTERGGVIIEYGTSLPLYRGPEQQENKTLKHTCKLTHDLFKHHNQSCIRISTENCTFGKNTPPWCIKPPPFSKLFYSCSNWRTLFRFHTQPVGQNQLPKYQLRWNGRPASPQMIDKENRSTASIPSTNQPSLQSNYILYPPTGSDRVLERAALEQRAAGGCGSATSIVASLPWELRAGHFRPHTKASAESPAAIITFATLAKPFTPNQGAIISAPLMQKDIWREKQKKMRAN